jgi:large subunit ribosomal protein L3
MKYLLGTKVAMTEFFAPNGEVTPVTVISAGPITVTGVKTRERDGYAAVKVGYGQQKESRLSKSVVGETKAHGVFRHLKEFRPKTGEIGEVKAGDTFDVSTFAPGDTIRVTGTSKAKGFQGVVKRHGFHGGPRSHGQKHSEREPGSIGGGLRNRVPKGMRMAGRTGGDTITVTNLKVVATDTENNLLLVKGAVPGRRGTLLAIVG